MIDIGDSRKPRYYEGQVWPFYRKPSPTKTVTLYLPSLDVWMDPNSRFHHKRRQNTLNLNDNPFKRGVIEGVVGFNPDIFSNLEKVFVEVIARTTYNKSLVDRYNFNINKIVFRSYRCLYPSRSWLDEQHLYDDLGTYWKPIQDFIKRDKTHHIPFNFDLNDAPDSVWMYDSQDTTPDSLQNGTSWEVYAYVSVIQTTTPNIYETAKLKIRKLTYIPSTYELLTPLKLDYQDRQFCTCSCKTDNGVITLVAKLDKDKYCHKEPIKVYIKIHNSSARVIQSVRISAEQITTFDLYENHDNLIRIDSILLNDELKELPILPYIEDWKTMVMLNPNVDRADRKEIAIEPPERHGPQNPLDCYLASTSFFPTELDMFKELRKSSSFHSPEYLEDQDAPRTKEQLYRSSHNSKALLADIPQHPISVRYRVNVRVECSTPMTPCIRYEAPEINLPYDLVHCKPTQPYPIKVGRKKMNNMICMDDKFVFQDIPNTSTEPNIEPQETKQQKGKVSPPKGKGSPTKEKSPKSKSPKK